MFNLELTTLYLPEYKESPSLPLLIYVDDILITRNDPVSIAAIRNSCIVNFILKILVI